MSDLAITELQKLAVEIDEFITDKRREAKTVNKHLNSIYSDINEYTLRLQRIQEGIHTLKTIKELTGEG